MIEREDLSGHVLNSGRHGITGDQAEVGFPAWVLGVRGLRDHLTPDPHLGGGLREEGGKRTEHGPGAACGGP